MRCLISESRWRVKSFTKTGLKGGNCLLWEEELNFGYIEFELP